MKTTPNIIIDQIGEWVEEAFKNMDGTFLSIEAWLLSLTLDPGLGISSSETSLFSERKNLHCSCSSLVLQLSMPTEASLSLFFNSCTTQFKDIQHPHLNNTIPFTQLSITCKLSPLAHVVPIYVLLAFHQIEAAELAIYIADVIFLMQDLAWQSSQHLVNFVDSEP